MIPAKPWYRMTKAEWIAACKVALTAAKEARSKEPQSQQPEESD